MPTRDEIRIAIESDEDVVAARQQGRTLGQSLDLNATDLTLLATAISEVARNITAYAGHGSIRLRPVEEQGRHGVEVVAEDQGPGIADLAAAMSDGYSTGRGLGLGLPGARRLMDHFEIDSRVDAGTRVRMIKWSWS
jgi:serine/threonine-protein kinase RsbT